MWCEVGLVQEVDEQSLRDAVEHSREDLVLLEEDSAPVLGVGGPSDDVTQHSHQLSQKDLHAGTHTHTGTCTCECGKITKG